MGTKQIKELLTEAELNIKSELERLVHAADFSDLTLSVETVTNEVKGERPSVISIDVKIRAGL